MKNEQGEKILKGEKKVKKIHEELDKLLNRHIAEEKPQWTMSTVISPEGTASNSLTTTTKMGIKELSSA